MQAQNFLPAGTEKCRHAAGAQPCREGHSPALAKAWEVDLKKAAKDASTKLDYRELLRQMIISSDNTAANVIIRRVGMDAVNAEAKALDLKATRLQRIMMDLDAAKEGRDNYTSADDLAKLLQMVYDGTFVDRQSSKLMLEILERQEDNDCISKGLPSGTKFAHKTGSGTTVLHDGGIVEGDHPFVLVCLCGDDDRFSDEVAQEAMANVGKVAYADSVSPSAGR
jgi:beta-lactamase class A